MRNRQSIRLQSYDYSKAGMYFITICTYNDENLFGRIIDGIMILNDAGMIAHKYWMEITNHFPNVILDEFIIMPNHIHGIIQTVTAVGVQHLEPSKRHEPIKRFDPTIQNEPERANKFQHIISGSIGSIIRGFKVGVTKWFRKNTNIYHVWHRNFFERIIRTEIELNNVRQYIIDNPKKWELKKNKEHFRVQDIEPVQMP
ncbi:MAG: transposase [Candidatus Delongbacteria bacterium]|nr:transposase [Candidatus Delongbacteria bacterium]